MYQESYKKRRSIKKKLTTTECNLLTNEELEAGFRQYYKIGDRDLPKFNLLQNIKDCPKNVPCLKIKKQQTRKRDKTEFERKCFINKLVCKNLSMRTFSILSAQIDQLVKK